jgi:hypothetical protein
MQDGQPCLLHFIPIAGDDRAARDIAANRNVALTGYRYINASRFALVQPTAYVFRQRLILSEQLLELSSQRNLSFFVFRRFRNILRRFECRFFRFDFRLQLRPK